MTASPHPRRPQPGAAGSDAARFATGAGRGARGPGAGGAGARGAQSRETAGGRAENRAEVRAEALLGSARGVRRFLAAVALVGSIQIVFMLGVEAYRAVESERAIAKLRNDITRLEHEAAELEAVLRHADDNAFREQLARLRGFIYPDEIRVVPLR